MLKSNKVEPNYIPVLHDRVKTLCTQRGVKIGAVGQLIGKSPLFFNNVFKGKQNIYLEDVGHVADVLGTTPEYLLGVSDDPTPEKKTAATTDDIKVALFGGDGEVTDAMWDEVVKFAEYVKSKHSKGEI